MPLQEVLLDALRDMYSAENQLVKALPKLAKGANDAKLRELFTAHLEETKGQVERLKEVFEHLEEEPTGEECKGMQGIVEEGKEALEKDEVGASFDCGLAGAGLRTEHYEIAGYQAAIAMAKTLGMQDVMDLLTENLNEEMAAAAKITDAVKPLMMRSAEEPKHGRDEQHKKKAPKPAKGRSSGQKNGVSSGTRKRA
jgi:ferritin-like metal-binding protein YciE